MMPEESLHNNNELLEMCIKFNIYFLTIGYFTITTGVFCISDCSILCGIMLMLWFIIVCARINHEIDVSSHVTPQLDVQGGCTRCVYKLGVQDVCTSWVYKLGVQAGCTSWVYKLGVQAGCTSWVYKLDVQAGCTSWVYKLDVQAGCTSWVYKLGMQVQE